MYKKRDHSTSTDDVSYAEPTISMARDKDAGVNHSSGITHDCLSGIEEIAQYDTNGFPFITVDGTCVRTRQQLQVALTKREKRRIKRVQRQCFILPWLKYTRPATNDEPTTTEEKDEQDELDFRSDLHLMTLDILNNKINTQEPCEPGLQTPIAHEPSNEDLGKSIARMEEIRVQLQKFREQTETEIMSYTPPEDEPRIRRQATFDIDRSKPIETSTSRLSINIKQQPLVRATTIDLLPTANVPPTLQNIRSASHLCKSSSSLVFGSNNDSQLKSNVLPRVSQIGDLLMHLPHNNREQHLHNNGYLMSIPPSLGSNNCNMEPSSLHSTCSRTIPQSTGCASEVIKKDLLINISAEYPAFQKRTCNFLKLPRILGRGKKSLQDC